MGKKRKYKCLTCGKPQSQKGDLGRHYLTEHSDQFSIDFEDYETFEHLTNEIYYHCAPDQSGYWKCTLGCIDNYFEREDTALRHIYNTHYRLLIVPKVYRRQLKLFAVMRGNELMKPLTKISKNKIIKIMEEIFGDKITAYWIGGPAIRNEFDISNEDLCCDGVIELRQDLFIVIEDKDSVQRKLLKHGIDQLKDTAKAIERQDHNNKIYSGFILTKSTHSNFYTKNKNYKKNEYNRLKLLNKFIRVGAEGRYIFVGFYGQTIKDLKRKVKMLNVGNLW